MANNDFLSNQGGHNPQHPSAVYEDFQGNIQNGTNMSHPPFSQNSQAHSGIKPGYEDCIQQDDGQCPPQLPNLTNLPTFYDSVPKNKNVHWYGFQNIAVRPVVSRNPATAEDVIQYHNSFPQPNAHNTSNCGQVWIPNPNQATFYPNQAPVYQNQVLYYPNQVSPHQATSPVSMNRPTSPQAMLCAAQMGQVKYPMHHYQIPSPASEGSCSPTSTISSAGSCTPTGSLSSARSSTPTSTTSRAGSCTPTSTTSMDGNCTSSSTISQASTGRVVSEVEDNSSMSELEEFAQDIKRRRYKLGLTQENVGDGLGALYNKHFSQTTVCRFEACQLSLTNMRKLKPVLEKWFHEVETNPASREIVDRGEKPKNSVKRKSRTCIEENTKRYLEKCYEQCSRPSKRGIEIISEISKKECKVIRNWFCNRRQKEKKELDKRLKEKPVATDSFAQPIPAPNTGNCVMPPMAVQQPYLIDMTGSNHTPFMATNNQNGQFIQHAMQRMPPGYYTQ
ncbi:POU domain, class 5, transcription factor -like [Pelobates cultripes]|uniref:POU domain, class 5, transcription factor -like n=1 Tax=Pelobates cultripes TaxID=61616 RepID=A0AAD1QZC0_PELCU|nr:POU domain, class 5, transcription factor -like [Pelobates cultripes]